MKYLLTAGGPPALQSHVSSPQVVSSFPFLLNLPSVFYLPFLPTGLQVLNALSVCFELSREAQAASVMPGQTLSAPQVDVPDRINADPYELIGMDNPDDKKEDYKTFYMKQKYRQDTYQARGVPQGVPPQTHCQPEILRANMQRLV